MSGLSVAMLQLDLCRTRSLCWIQPKLQGSWSAAWISCTTDSTVFHISTCVKLLPLPALFLSVFWACGTTFVAKSVKKAIAKIRRCKYQTATIATGNRGRVRHLFLKPVEFFPYAQGSRNGKHIEIETHSLAKRRLLWHLHQFCKPKVNWDLERKIMDRCCCFKVVWSAAMVFSLWMKMNLSSWLETEKKH